MKSLERLSPHVIVTIGIVVLVMMMALVLWSSSVFRRGIAMVAG